MNAIQKIPTELAAIAAIFSFAGGMLLLSVVLAATLLPRHPYPDRVIQMLFMDPSVRPLFLCEGGGALVLGIAAVVAGVATFARARIAGVALRATLGLATACLIADVVVQGWLIVPALRRLAPTLKPPESLWYHPRLRPALPIVVGVIVLAVLFGVARTLRRPRVRAALSGDQPCK